jgi:hypothetical protein
MTRTGDDEGRIAASALLPVKLLSYAGLPKWHALFYMKRAAIYPASAPTNRRRRTSAAR